MKERPILFNSAMVKAIISGAKSRTRRPVKPQPQTEGLLAVVADRYNKGSDWAFWLRDNRMTEPRTWSCPFGEPGDKLWVRETWAPMCRHADPVCYCASEDEFAKAYLDYSGHYVEYRADTGNKRPGDWPEPKDGEFGDAPKWRPSIHMPRWASRITLEVTDVRAERVQEITPHDALAEGVDYPYRDDAAPGERAICEFRELWNSVYPTTGMTWYANPWVWAISFRRLQ